MFGLFLSFGCFYLYLGSLFDKNLISFLNHNGIDIMAYDYMHFIKLYSHSEWQIYSNTTTQQGHSNMTHWQNSGCNKYVISSLINSRMNLLLQPVSV